MKTGISNFSITRDTIAGAKEYMPLARKMELAGEIAAKCCDVASAKIDIDNSELLVPEMRVENPALRQRYVLGALYTEYFGVEIEPAEGSECLLSLDDFDRAASTFPLNSMERIKSDAGVRDKVFNILRDYKDFERMVATEIQNLLTIHNDIVMRITLSLSMSVTPDALQKLSDAEGELRKQAVSMKETAMLTQQAIQARKDAEGATA